MVQSLKASHIVARAIEAKTALLSQGQYARVQLQYELTLHENILERAVAADRCPTDLARGEGGLHAVGGWPNRRWISGAATER